MASWRLKHPSTLAAIYALNGNALDGTGRYPGTLVNTPTWGTFLTGRGCIELDGNTQHVNVGDVAELNAVSAFSMCFWMAQDVLDQDDIMFWKRIDATHAIEVYTTVGGFLIILLNDGTGANAVFDYSTVISAGAWAHVAVVFDGSGAANASRLICYVNGIPVALNYTLTIPPATADLSGNDALIGHTTVPFDGKLYDFRIASCAYSRQEVIAIIHEAVPV